MNGINANIVMDIARNVKIIGMRELILATQRNNGQHIVSSTDKEQENY
jgi:hypothetical protein